MEWIEIKVRVTGFLREAVSNHCFEKGAQAVDENETTVLKAYFLPQDAAEAVRSVNDYLSSLRSMHPSVEIGPAETEVIPQGDWINEYKKYFHAQKLTERLYLVPQWEADKPVPAGFATILMEAGPAFGTGLHQSTRLSLRLLEQSLRHHPYRAKLTALDIGSGSGILAIAARKLGVPTIEAIEIDPISIEVALENFENNGCADIPCSDKSLAEFSAPYDVLLANILLETHRELVKDYRRLLKSGGCLIVSGLLGNQRAETVELFQQHGLRLVLSAAEQEWIALSFTLDFGET